MSPTLPRRQALRQAFFFSAAAALGLGLSGKAWAQDAGDRHFLLFGDFGFRERKSNPPKPGTQATVAAAMQRYVAGEGFTPDGLFLLGDNFYGPLKYGVRSPRWQEGFEEMYPRSVFPGPCWAVLGNHDYDDEAGFKVASELAYARLTKGTRWKLPAKWYRIDWPTADPLLTCLILDSNYRQSVSHLSADEIAEQNDWLARELEKERAPWTIACGHHPLYSNGGHGDSPWLIKDWLPLFQKHGVAAYFCGHDHDLQHLEFDGVGTSFVVSGGGGAGLHAIKKPERKIFSRAIHGFTHLQVSSTRLLVRHLDTTPRELYAFQRDREGRVAILTHASVRSARAESEHGLLSTDH